MKKTQRYGFTLVELLVVISIIGMLAGLLLPAVNAAREAGRRATCVSNQSQVALALLNYENARNAFPALRVENESGGTLSWAAQILINLEQNTMAEVLSRGIVEPTNGQDITTVTMPVLRCKSDTNLEASNAVSYVVNGGYQNTYKGTYEENASVDPKPVFERGHKSDAVFFDHLGGYASGSAVVYPKTTCSIDYISKNNGTGYVILLTENIEAGAWLERESSTVNKPKSLFEKDIAFCFPSDTAADEDKAWYNGSTAINYTFGDGTTKMPMFINQNRGSSADQYAKARPSSNHPGIVVAAFADRSVRPLNENMDKWTFVQICRPKSGAIVDPNKVGVN